MDLLECLSQVSGDQLNRIALFTGLDAGQDRDSLVRELFRCLTDRAWLQGLLSDLSDDEWAALKVIFFNGGDQGITVELCHQIVNLLSGKRRKTGARSVDDLLDRGLVYLRAQHYRQVYFIPTDLLAVLTEILNREVVFRVALSQEVPIRLTMPERDLVEDVHRFLAYIYKHEITLTQQGLMFKRHIRALLDLLLSGGDDEESLVGRYPEPLGLLMGYSQERHLVAREGGRLNPTADLETWITQATGVKQLDLFNYWRDRYYYQDLQAFLSVMHTVGEQWVSVDRLVLEVEPLINPSQRGSFLLRLKHHLSMFLCPLGLFELGSAGTVEEPELACRLTAAGVSVLEGQVPLPADLSAKSLLLQATFEAIAPRPIPADVLWTMELMADLVRRTDRTLTYRFSRQSVYRALKIGLTGPAMLQFLEQHSATGVPQNVAFDLRDWAGSYGQVFLQSVTLLRCASALLAEQIKASRRTAPFVLGELTPTDLIVNADQQRELLEALEADGLMPRPDGDERA